MHTLCNGARDDIYLILSENPLPCNRDHCYNSLTEFLSTNIVYTLQSDYINKKKNVYPWWTIPPKQPGKKILTKTITMLSQNWNLIKALTLLLFCYLRWMASWHTATEGRSLTRIKKHCALLSKAFTVSWGGDIGKFSSIVKAMLKYCMAAPKSPWWNSDSPCT